MTITTASFLQNKFINVTLRYYNLDYFPLPPYLALYTTDPTEDDVGTEISGNGYARVEYTVTSATNGSAYNSSVLAFPKATGSWGNFDYIGIRSGSEAGENTGNLLFFGQLSSTATVNENDVLVIPAGGVKVSLGGAYRSYLAEELLEFVLFNSTPRTGGPNFGVQKYAALFSAIPPAEGESWEGGTTYELSAPGYSRVNAGNWTAPESGSSTNISTITFTVSAPSDWGDVKAVGLSDSATADTFFYITLLSASRTILSGDAFRIESGSLVVSLS